MIDAFEEMCIWVYVTVDDLYREITRGWSRKGPLPACRDSEVLTIILVSECKGWENESEWVQHWWAYRSLFGAFPERSRLNRRRRRLSGVLNLIRYRLVQSVEGQLDSRCIVDSAPLEVVAFSRVPQSRGDWWANGARYGHNATKRQTFFGYKLYLLVTVTGFLVDFMIAPANVDERVAADELLDIYTDLFVLADKGFISRPWANALAQESRITLVTEGRSNQRDRMSKAQREWLHTHRQRIETVFAQLASQFRLQRTLARSFCGFATRLIAKLTAHTLSCVIRMRQGFSDWLRIKAFAFPF